MIRQKYKQTNKYTDRTTDRQEKERKATICHKNNSLIYEDDIKLKNINFKIF